METPNIDYDIVGERPSSTVYLRFHWIFNQSCWISSSVILRIFFRSDIIFEIFARLPTLLRLDFYSPAAAINEVTLIMAQTIRAFASKYLIDGETIILIKVRNDIVVWRKEKLQYTKVAICLFELYKKLMYENKRTVNKWRRFFLYLIRGTIRTFEYFRLSEFNTE